MNDVVNNFKNLINFDHEKKEETQKDLLLSYQHTQIHFRLRNFFIKTLFLHLQQCEKHLKIPRI